MTKITQSATDMLAILGIISELAWQDNHPELAGFDGAELIADVPADAAGPLSTLLEMPAAHGLIAAIGGDEIDGRQLEIHGCSADGEPLNWSIHLQPWSGC